MVHYIYVLQSEKDNKFYTGLIYFEGCLNQKDATHREKYLKTHFGKLFIKNRLKSYLTG